MLRAEAAEPALQILKRQGRIDLMLTDLIMPGGMNGVELAHEAVAIRPGLPIILTSGTTGETLGEATEAPWPLLAKPYPGAGGPGGGDRRGDGQGSRAGLAIP